jgi:RNA polymerase sigma-70 factor, ECF subfamily
LKAWTRQPPQPGESALLASAPSAAESAEPLTATADFPTELLDELWRTGRSADVGLIPFEFVLKLLDVGTKHNFSLGPGVTATPAQRGSFFRGLHLANLALAHACVLGRDAAWQAFLERYREPLRQAATGITGSSSLGAELADSLYSELFGLTEREGRRGSPLASYSGRGALMGWLRTTLAQRYVDHLRRTHRETPIEDQDFSASITPPATPPVILAQLKDSLRATLQELGQEDRFLLSAYYLDQQTLLQIARVLRVHEATVSRRLKRLARNLHAQLLKHLEACGMSQRAAEEALGADPREIDLNLPECIGTKPSNGTNRRATSVISGGA